MATIFAFWNVQRMFDARGGSVHAALTGGERRPEPAEVDAKVASVGAILAALGQSVGTPALLGLAEIETAGLVERVARASGLRLSSAEGQIADELGCPPEALDLSLLYDPSRFGPPTRIRSHVLDRSLDTRDVLELQLTDLVSGRPVSVLVNHWPSRVAFESLERRVAAAHHVRQLVAEGLRFQPRELWNPAAGELELPAEEAFRERASRAVVVMGDFNDEPFDQSLQILDATPDLAEVAAPLSLTGRKLAERYQSYLRWTPRLFNPFWSLCTGEQGTYYASPRWRTYDQILLSPGALELFGAVPRARVFSLPDVGVGASRIRLRTALGRPLPFDYARREGVSDHLAAYITDAP